MFELKRLSVEAVDRALDKAMRYRLLNEPEQAESICLDVLAVAPDHQGALVTLILALTDQFGSSAAETVARALDLVPRLHGEYERAYYRGLIAERRANARLAGLGTGSDAMAYDLYRQAMAYYEQAEALSPPGNEDARLRWNACARQIMRHGWHLRGDETPVPEMLE